MFLWLYECDEYGCLENRRVSYSPEPSAFGGAPIPPVPNGWQILQCIVGTNPTGSSRGFTVLCPTHAKGVTEV